MSAPGTSSAPGAAAAVPPQVLVAGGGMITADLILPSLYHLQRLGRIGAITVCALGSAPLKALAENEPIRAAFPGSSFTPRPPLSTPPEQKAPDLFSRLVKEMPPRQVAVIAVPDPLHHELVMQALRSDQHVICVKPLVLRGEHAVEIEREARRRGLFVGVEYHKRFDRRSLVARRDYRAGKFGEFRFGEARLMEPYYYRRSNFQNWFLPEATDPFTYVGCHYVDLAMFITGLRPVEVAVSGVRGTFPNGNEGILWSLASVRWDNGALLSVANGLGYPDHAAGSNDQGLVMYCEGPESSGMIVHDDHHRGVAHSYLEPRDADGPRYSYVSPDFFRLVPWEGEGLRPIGYGFDSIEALVAAVRRVEDAASGLAGGAARQARVEALRAIDEAALVATPANSAANDLVVEAGRISITHGGKPVRIEWSGSSGRVATA
ncbi:MAG TPA: Gfo/Idh/MocA family oxidoreductase [Spirochaetia bacterium]|nr:Gfo/Idh/MocA family oxidoreductase [Spirochaetia bacterium]